MLTDGESCFTVSFSWVPTIRKPLSPESFSPEKETGRRGTFHPFFAPPYMGSTSYIDRNIHFSHLNIHYLAGMISLERSLFYGEILHS